MAHHVKWIWHPCSNACLLTFPNCFLTEVTTTLKTEVPQHKWRPDFYASLHFHWGQWSTRLWSAPHSAWHRPHPACRGACWKPDLTKKKELWTHLNFRLWGASLQRLEYIIRVIFYTEWIEGEVSFTYSPIKLWRTLTLRRSSGNDWSGCILQIAFALFNSPLHWSVSCTFLCSRRLHFCLKNPKHDK